MPEPGNHDLQVPAQRKKSGRALRAEAVSEVRGQREDGELSPASASDRSPVTHRLKAHPGAFRAVKRGDKRCEIRRDDRGFMDGHRLLLQEWDPVEQCYTGDEVMLRVSHIVRGPDWELPRGLVVMSVAVIPMPIHVTGDAEQARKQRVIQERKARDAVGAEDL